MVRARSQLDPLRAQKLLLLRQAALANPRAFIENPNHGLKIVHNLTGQVVPMTFTWSQNQLQNEIDSQRKDNKPVRIIVCKSRQVRISSGVAADLYTNWFSRDNFYGLVMAHERDVTEALFRTKYKFFHENLPEYMQLPLERSNKSELYAANTGSVLQVVTAKGKLSTRSRTLWYVHGSECAFYDDFKTVKGGLEPSIARVPWTTIIWESTANGVGGHFYEVYQGAKAGENGYKHMFLEWFKDPTMSLDPLPWRSQKEMDAYMEFVYSKRPDLKDRAQHYLLTPAQVAFYYDRLMNSYGGDDQWMMQEYPCDDTEAFIASGSPVFPTRMTSEYAQKTKDGNRYDPTRKFAKYDDLRAAQHLQPNKDTYLEIWERPRDDRYYVISVDPSAGHQTSDYLAAYVVDMFTQNIVAVLHGREEPKKFTEEMLIPLGKMYRGQTEYGALIACERDGIGEVVISHLKDKYFNLYQWRKDVGYGVKFTNTIGFEVNPTSRVLLIANGRRMFSNRRGDGSFIPDKMLIDEITKFVYASDGKPQAAKGCHDDRVMAWLIALTVCLQELETNPALMSAYERMCKKLEESPIQKVTYEDMLRLTKDPRWTGEAFVDFPEDNILDGPFYNGGDEEFELW